MNGGVEFGEQQRPDALRITGVAALSGVDYDALVADLRSRGLTVEPMGVQVPEARIMSTTPTVLGDVAIGARAEREAEPVGMTLTDIKQFAAAEGVTDPGTITGIWNGLRRNISFIAEAKDWVAAGRPKSEFWESQSDIRHREFLAQLDLAALPRAEGEDEAIDVASLYGTLAMVLKDGYPSGPSMLHGLGKRRLSILASFVNERLRPDTPLPLYEDIGAGLEPLPPLYPRTLHMDSQYVQPVRSGRRTEAVVSRDDLHRFAVDTGIPPNQTGHFLAIFRDLAELSSGLAPQRRDDDPHWIDREVCFLRMYDVVGGLGDREVWGIRLERFVELVYDLERTPELRERVAGYGPQVRRLLRQYLRTVAPYTPSVRALQE